MSEIYKEVLEFENSLGVCSFLYEQLIQIEAYDMADMLEQCYIDTVTWLKEFKGKGEKDIDSFQSKREEVDSLLLRSLRKLTELMISQLQNFILQKE